MSNFVTLRIENLSTCCLILSDNIWDAQSMYMCNPCTCTSQMLSDRIKQHVPKSIRTGQFSQERSVLFRSFKSFSYSVSIDSAIGNISWIANCAHFITITIDSQCFPLVALLFISPLWKLLSLELFNLISVDKNNSFTALKSFVTHSILIGRSLILSN